MRGNEQEKGMVDESCRSTSSLHGPLSGPPVLGIGPGGCGCWHGGWGRVALSGLTTLRSFFVYKKCFSFCFSDSCGRLCKELGCSRQAQSLSSCPRRAPSESYSPFGHLVQITRKGIQQVHLGSSLPSWRLPGLSKRKTGTGLCPEGTASPLVGLTVLFSCSMTGIPRSPRWWWMSCLGSWEVCGRVGAVELAALFAAICYPCAGPATSALPSWVPSEVSFPAGQPHVRPPL